MKVASVATYFPSGQADTQLKIEDARRVVAAGADEVDMVIDRGAFLSGDYFKVFDEVRRVKDDCPPKPTGTILISAASRKC